MNALNLIGLALSLLALVILFAVPPKARITVTYSRGEPIVELITSRGVNR